MYHKVLSIPYIETLDTSVDDILTHTLEEFIADFPMKQLVMLTHLRRDAESSWEGDKYTCWVGPLQNNEDLYAKIDITHTPSGFKGSVLHGDTEWANTTHFPCKLQVFEQENADIDPDKFPLIGEAKFSYESTGSSEIRWVSRGALTNATDSMQIMEAILNGFKIPYTLLQDQATVTDDKLPLNLLRAFEGKPPYYERFGYTHPPFFRFSYLNDEDAPSQSQSSMALNWAFELIRSEPVDKYLEDFQKAGLSRTEIRRIERIAHRTGLPLDLPTSKLLDTLNVSDRAIVTKSLTKLTKAYLNKPLASLRACRTSSKRTLALSTVAHHAFMLKTRENAPKKRKRIVVTLFNSVIKTTQANSWPELAKEIGL